ncbi:hypothetical protein ES703_122144 [subsurface metagenome]
MNSTKIGDKRIEKNEEVIRIHIIRSVERKLWSYWVVCVFLVNGKGRFIFIKKMVSLMGNILHFWF